MGCGGREDNADCEDDFEREEREDIVDVGREGNLKIYIWEEGRVTGCAGDGGREMYPIEEVLLKKELDHKDELI